MPIYEFLCQTCGTEFEMVRSFSDSTTPACPKCAGANVQRQLSRPAIHFKGSGWYINDSKNSSKASAIRNTGSDDNSAEPEAKSSEAKPEGEKAGDVKEKESKETKVTESKGAEAKASVTKSTETTTTSKSEK